MRAPDLKVQGEIGEDTERYVNNNIPRDISCPTVWQVIEANLLKIIIAFLNETHSLTEAANQPSVNFAYSTSSKIQELFFLHAIRLRSCFRKHFREHIFYNKGNLTPATIQNRTCNGTNGEGTAVLAEWAEQATWGTLTSTIIEENQSL